QKKMTSVGKTLSKTLTLPLVALGTASVMAADTQVQAETRLLTALKGREDIQRRLMAQAAELQSRSTFGDEEVIAQQAYLASLGMTERQINDVIEASAQLSVATGMTLESAVKNLAKTYGGLTGELGESIPALKNLTAEQLKSGEAVRFILENYKGYAEAAAQSGAGSMRQLKNQLGDLAEKLGMILMPALQKIVGWISNMVTWFQNLSPTTQKVIVVIASLAAAIGPVLTVGGKLLAMLPLIKAAFTAMTGPIGLVISALVALGAAFVSARQQQAEFARQQAEQARQNFEERKRENYDRTYNEFSRPIYSDEDIQKRMKIVYETWAEDKAAFERIQNGKGFTQAQADALNVQREEWLALNDILNQRRRSAEDAAAMQAQYNNSLKQTTTGATEANGLIGQLQRQIRALEESLGNAKTVEEIAATNAQIAELRGELSRLQDIKPEDLKPIEKLEPILASDFEIEFPAPKLKMDGIKLAVSEYSQQMSEIFSTVREELFGWADNTSTYLAKNLSATVEMVENYTTALTNKGWNFTAALDHVSQTVASTMQRFDQQVSQFLADSIVAAADALGKVIAGDLGFGGLMKAILTQFANFLKNIGAQLIEFGIMIIAFKSALKSVLANPWAAIGIGAAMVAAAAIMTALINKNAQESVPALATGGLAYGKTLALVGDNPNAIADPEVIAPLSKLQAMLPSGGGQNIKLTLGGQLVAKGRDLVYVLGKENFKTSILGG
uniref:phage tail tape measure protein n=1 Tax=Alistipes sp. TaxID=1872444 RepID=UPI004056075E